MPTGAVPVPVELAGAELREELKRPVRLPEEFSKSNGVEVAVELAVEEGVKLAVDVRFAEGTIDPDPPVPESTVVPPDSVALASPAVVVMLVVMVMLFVIVKFPEDGEITPLPPVPERTVVIPDTELLNPPDVGTAVVNAVSFEGTGIEPEVGVAIVSLLGGVVLAAGAVKLTEGVIIPDPPETNVTAVPPDEVTLATPEVSEADTDTDVTLAGRVDVGIITLKPSTELPIAVLPVRIALALPEVGTGEKMIPPPPVERTVEEFPEMVVKIPPETTLGICVTFSDAVGEAEIIPPPAVELSSVVPPLMVPISVPPDMVELRIRLVGALGGGAMVLIPPVVLDVLVESMTVFPYPPVVLVPFSDVEVGETIAPDPVELEVTVAPEMVA